MGSGWQEWPLVLFTVLGQSVVGGLIVTGLGWIAFDNNPAAQRRVVRSMFFLWVIMGLAFVASVLHLGSPWRALNSLNRLGQSALSNEIASGSLFFAIGGFWWLLSFLHKLPEAVAKFVLLLSMVAGLFFVWAMTRVYQIDTVPTWHTGYTTLSFFLTVALTGPVLGAVLLRQANVSFSGSRFATLSIIALLVVFVASFAQAVSLAGIHSSVQQATNLLPHYAQWQTARMVLLVSGLGCWACPLVRRKNPSLPALLSGWVLVILGELIGRGLFYGLHMTVGMAVAS
ncbi:DmsC/YnfH family molybdoenzyme membrane anchor subunit [Mangrovibacter plantisponsor]|uniref:Tat-targeted selenate reductase subunit YnfH n=1 Tax=Mangrovibacter plantisponsor TaxID=451513 RepID=A0A317Q5Y2_9ENTR|nr:DmsC/YnfH family molybdoenzyme membrane anchor subunit [Mangrovibacter plantisponsor]PWW10980.1 Tat-targeted selenate reductase subunit YnfH [Mangrovibacter plantisponsor]